MCAEYALYLQAPQRDAAEAVAGAGDAGAASIAQRWRLRFAGHMRAPGQATQELAGTYGDRAVLPSWRGGRRAASRRAYQGGPRGFNGQHGSQGSHVAGMCHVPAVSGRSVAAGPREALGRGAWCFHWDYIWQLCAVATGMVYQGSNFSASVLCAG